MLLAFFLMGLLVWFGRFDTSVYRELLGGTSLVMIAGVAAGAAAMVVFTLIRWWVLLRAQRLPASLFEVFRVGCMGCFANLVAPAGMGFEAIRLLYLRQHHRGRVMIGFTTMVMDRLLGLIALLLLSAFFCCWLLGSAAHRITAQLLLANLLFLGVILFAVLALFDLLPITITQRLAKIPWLGNGFVAIREFRNHRGVLAICMLLSFAAHSSICLATWCAIAALRQPVSIVSVFTVTPIVSFSPCGFHDAARIGRQRQRGGGALSLSWIESRCRSPNAFARRAICVVHRLRDRLLDPRQRSEATQPIDENDMKQTIDDLAILGGSPAFTEELHVGRPNLGDRQLLMDRIDRILDSRRLTNNGDCVRELESRIADYVGVKHCVAVCNGTIALSILVRAAGLSGKVVVPSFTFVATVHALQWQEITPVFCDIDPQTHTLDPQCLDARISPEISGVIGVHTWGHTRYIDSIVDVARRHKVFLAFDAAHAFGCSQHSQRVGGFGEAEVFSFHATKFFNTFEGGAITTNNNELAEKSRLMRNFGFSGFDNVIHLGINGKMTEVSAAMGLSMLPRLDELLAINRENFGYYEQGVGGLSAFHLIGFDGGEESNYQYVVLEIDPEVAGLDRDEVLDVLHAENVIARRYFYPGCHQMEPYKQIDPNAGAYLPRTAEAVKKTLVLPTGDQIDRDDIAEICQVLSLVCDHGSEIRERLASS